MWTLLAARPVQAQVAPTPPSCSIPGSVTDDNDTTTPNLEVAAITIQAGNLTANPSGEITAAREIDYFRIIIPDLVVGDLSVTASGTLGRSVARLCRGGSPVATHPNIGTGPAPDDEAHASIKGQKVTPGTYYIVVRGQDVTDAGVRVASDAHPTGTYSLAVSFSGVYPTKAGTSAAGELLSRGERDSFALTTSINGLLTVRTTGSTDTKGTFTGSGADMEVTADDGGSGRNFRIIASVEDGNKMVFVEGQVPTETGDYTLDVDFEVATDLTLDSDLVGTTNGNTRSGQTDYFFFAVAAKQGLMTIRTVKHDDIASGAGTPTRGTLYGPKGLITTDDNSGAGGNFRLSAPVAAGNYIVKVDRQGTGQYTLDVSTETATVVAPGATATSVMVMAPTGSNPSHVRAYHVTVTTAGTLQVQTTMGVDTVGELYGPDGELIATDEDSGQDSNFKFTRYLMPGGYIVLVRAADRMTDGDYVLRTGFIEGEVASGPPPEPVDPMECPEPEMFPVDATGALENPSGDGFRSGVGVISGWVCSANEVEVVITSNDRQGSSPVTLAVAYGTSRADTVEHCEHNDPNTGFGMTYNFNHLREGEYTIRAFADNDELIGSAQTFNVVHLTTFAVNDDDRFLRDEDGWSLQGTECRVDNFPDTGEATILEWEESTQNFMIIDAG